MGPLTSAALTSGVATAGEASAASTLAMEAKATSATVGEGAEAAGEVREAIVGEKGLLEQLDAIHHSSLESIAARNESAIKETSQVVTQESREQLPAMSNETRDRLQEQGYSTTILDSIGSEAEAKIYEDAGLEPTVINGKDVLIRNDIDYDQKDIDGKTNLERMKEGKAPLDANGKPIELHHIGQNQNSPLAELTRNEHMGNGNDSILHNKSDESKIDREDFANERKEHWKARAEQIENQRS